MKSAFYTKFAISTAFASTIFAANACSAPPSVDIWECLPNPLEASPRCAKPIDAGTDAESDAGADGSNLKGSEDPGLEPASIFHEDACKTACVPEADGPFAAGWSDRPVMVWIGPSSELASHHCDGGETWEKVRGYDKLVAPPAKCDACACLADGACTGLPATIEIRSDKCGVSNVQTTPFDGPANWDGSCTSANAMAAGELCNGVLCAQSVGTSALPGPTNESCTPTAEKPTATLGKHEWLEGVLACGADSPGNCNVPAERCVPPLKEGWLRCVWQAGKHNECPGNYNDFPPRVVYQDNPIDDRGCSECVCGAPKDGICTGSLSVYADSVCSSEFVKLPLSSIDPSCGTITPPGRVVGGKTISGLSYVPGTCAVTGGEPIGSVIPNDNEKSVTTICCRGAEPPPLPPIH